MNIAVADEIQRALAEYVEEPSPGLVLELHVARLLDAESCTALMERLHKQGGPWEVVPAKEHLDAQLPKTSGLYMFVWSTPAVLSSENEDYPLKYPLYVGKAGNQGGSTLRTRYKEYSAFIAGDMGKLWETNHPKTRNAMLAKWLTLKPLEYWFLSLPTVEDDEISRLEKRLIRLLNPPLNRSHKPSLRIAAKTSPAF